MKIISKLTKLDFCDKLPHVIIDLIHMIYVFLVNMSIS